MTTQNNNWEEELKQIVSYDWETKDTLLVQMKLLISKQISLAVTEERRKLHAEYYKAILKYAETFTADQGEIKVWIERDKLLELINKITTEDSTPSINTDSATKID